MKELPLLLPLLLIVVLFTLGQRARRKAVVRDAEQQQALGPGVRVMTTSGLYGTIVALDGDTAQLEIAPGVQVTWARAALRDPASLPARRGLTRGATAPANGPTAAPAAPPQSPSAPAAES